MIFIQSFSQCSAPGYEYGGYLNSADLVRSYVESAESIKKCFGEKPHLYVDGRSLDLFKLADAHYQTIQIIEGSDPRLFADPKMNLYGLIESPSFYIDGDVLLRRPPLESIMNAGVAFSHIEAGTHYDVVYGNATAEIDRICGEIPREWDAAIQRRAAVNVGLLMFNDPKALREYRRDLLAVRSWVAPLIDRLIAESRYQGFTTHLNCCIEQLTLAGTLIRLSDTQSLPFFADGGFSGDSDFLIHYAGLDAKRKRYQ